MVVGLVYEGPFTVHGYFSFFDVQKLADMRYSEAISEKQRVSLLRASIVSVCCTRPFHDGRFGAAAWRQLGTIANRVHTALMGSDRLKDAACAAFSRLPAARDVSLSRAPGVGGASGMSGLCLLAVPLQ
jgi:hypothetical protein